MGYPENIFTIADPIDNSEYSISTNPSCELHVHIEGCVWIEHIQNWWNKSAFLFPPPTFIDGPNRFNNFLNYLRFGYNFLNSIEAYSSVAFLYANKAIIHNIRYVEFQINFALVETWGIELKALLQDINESINKANPNLIARYIIDLPWQFSPDMLLSIIKDAPILYLHGFRGISMGGAENFARPKDVAHITNLAKDENIKILCHAGETTSYDFSRRIVETLKPHRVAHALSIADWIMSLGSDAPVIDVCLTSNLSLGSIRSLQEHPLNRWVNAGVPFCLSTDDPAIFNTNLSMEYDLAFSIIPDFIQQWEKVKKNFLRGSLDPIAAQQALSADA